MGRAGRSGFAGVLTLLLALPGGASGEESAPGASKAMRLALELPSRTFSPGGELVGHVVLRRLDGTEAPAPRPLTVHVESQLEGEQAHGSDVTIAAGAGRADFRVTAGKPGLLQLRATHPELLEAGTFVRCVPPAAAPAAVGDAGPAAQAGAPRGRPPKDDDHRGMEGAKAPRRSTASGPGGRSDGGGGRITAPAPKSGAHPEGAGRANAPYGLASEAHDPRPRLTLRISPQRPLLADGKDSLSLHVFLDRAAPSDLKLNVFSTIGRLAPWPLVIARGESEGAAQLTGQHPGDVEIELVSSEPPADVDGERKLKARFAAPVTSLYISADPANATFVETAQVTIQLLDGSGRTVATDAPRTVDLTLDRGHGVLASEHLTIAAGQSEVSTTFEPTWPGPVAFSASTPSLFRQSTTLRITWPVGLLLISLLGGIVGGALAPRRDRRQHAARIATGAVTGFVLYWAFIAGLLPVLPRQIVLNPLSAFALSTLGGWMGTEVFTLVLRKLGIADEDGVKAEAGAGASEGRAREGGAEEAEGDKAKPRRRRADGE
ncbi:MAG TPA: hypothetical protein VH877_33350 [Polyangia bacterium]|nr:hypothetical protein [Polyangia bacterium]